MRNKVWEDPERGTKRSPAYVRLYEALREEVLRGGWTLGEKLPSRRQLARERGLSAVTVEHSLELLVQEGYVEARPRSGFVVIYREEDGFAQGGRQSGHMPEIRIPHEFDPSGMFNEGGAVNPSANEGLFPFSVLARTMRGVLTERGEEILSRSPGAGLLELREAIARYLGRNRGIWVSPEQIIIGAGAEYLYGLVVELLGREKIVGIEYPSYQKIEQVYRAKGVTCELLALGRDGILTEALWGAQAQVLHISPYRSFPTGVTASASKRSEYLRWAEEEDRWIVEDDFESEFSLLRKPEETVFARAERENVIYLNTFTRTISPGLRLGYMVLPARLMKAAERRIGFYSCPVPVFEQMVIASLLEGGEFERHINRVRREKRKQSGGRG